jgi:hypothetical protein
MSSLPFFITLFLPIFSGLSGHAATRLRDAFFFGAAKNRLCFVTYNFTTISQANQPLAAGVLIPEHYFSADG